VAVGVLRSRLRASLARIERGLFLIFGFSPHYLGVRYCQDPREEILEVFVLRRIIRFGFHLGHDTARGVGQYLSFLLGGSLLEYRPVFLEPFELVLSGSRRVELYSSARMFVGNDSELMKVLN
jgi:hypothetical protein